MPPWRRLRPYLPFMLVLVVVAPVYGTVRWLDPTLLAAALRGLRPEWLAVVAALTASNVAVMGAYDVLAFRRTRATWTRRWFNGSVAFAWSNFLTFGPVAGPSVRFWLYRDCVEGLASLRDGVVLVSLGFGSGLAGWGLGAGLTRYLPLETQALALPIVAFACTGAAAFAGAKLLRGLGLLGPEVVNGSVAGMAALGWLDWGLAWAAFAACLLAADMRVAIPGSATAFFVGQIVGLATLVPGGLGGSDAWWVLHLRGPAPAIVSAILAYRVLYYFLPWSIASIAMLSTAGPARRRRASIPAPDPVR